jgi:hypothetical protein
VTQGVLLDTPSYFILFFMPGSTMFVDPDRIHHWANATAAMKTQHWYKKVTSSKDLYEKAKLDFLSAYDVVKQRWTAETSVNPTSGLSPPQLEQISSLVANQGHLMSQVLTLQQKTGTPAEPGSKAQVLREILEDVGSAQDQQARLAAWDVVANSQEHKDALEKAQKTQFFKGKNEAYILDGDLQTMEDNADHIQQFFLKAEQVMKSNRYHQYTMVCYLLFVIGPRTNQWWQNYPLPPHHPIRGDYEKFKRFITRALTPATLEKRNKDAFKLVKYLGNYEVFHSKLRNLQLQNKDVTAVNIITDKELWEHVITHIPADMLTEFTKQGHDVATDPLTVLATAQSWEQTQERTRHPDNSSRYSNLNSMQSEGSNQQPSDADLFALGDDSSDLEEQEEMCAAVATFNKNMLSRSNRSPDQLRSDAAGIKAKLACWSCGSTDHISTDPACPNYQTRQSRPARAKWVPQQRSRSYSPNARPKYSNRFNSYGAKPFRSKPAWRFKPRGSGQLYEITTEQENELIQSDGDDGLFLAVVDDQLFLLA